MTLFTSEKYTVLILVSTVSFSSFANQFMSPVLNNVAILSKTADCDAVDKNALHWLQR